MKAERRDGSDERRILTAMLLDKTVLARVASKWDGALFRTPWANQIAKWALDYYERYERAPEKNIESIYENWAEDAPDKNQVSIIAKFLAYLNAEYEAGPEINTDYITDLAGRYFNRVRLGKLTEAIQADLDTGEIDKARDRAETFNRIELGAGAGIDALEDENAMREALDGEATEALVEYPGALGKFFGDALARDAFVSFMGPEKRGKTFWLLDLAFRAIAQRRRVAFFQCGDLSQNQMMRRILIRASRWPRYPGECEWPVSIGRDEDDELPTVEFETKTFDTGISWQLAAKRIKKGIKRGIKSDRSFLKLSTHPNTTLSVAGIESALTTWEREEWIADVIVIDYADIMDLGTGSDERERTNQTWARLRRLSQKYHCLVVTATQSDTDSYDAHTIKRKNFSADKRKLAHVTGMIGINQTADERKISVMRLNWVVQRENPYDENVCCYAAGCLPLANPAVRSCF